MTGSARANNAGMASTVFDLIGKHAIEKGFPWSFIFTRYAGPSKTPVDLTGQVCSLDIYDALSPGAPILSVSTTSGEIVLGGATGRTEIDLTAQQTLISATTLRYRLVFTDATGRRHPFLHGRLGIESGQ